MGVKRVYYILLQHRRKLVVPLYFKQYLHIECLSLCLFTSPLRMPQNLTKSHYGTGKIIWFTLERVNLTKSHYGTGKIIWFTLERVYRQLCV